MTLRGKIEEFDAVFERKLGGGGGENRQSRGSIVSSHEEALEERATIKLC